MIKPMWQDFLIRQDTYQTRVTEMDQKAIISVLFAAVVALIGWNIKTTNDLQLQVQRLEIILLDDAFTK